MKFIPYRDRGTMKTTDVLTLVIAQGQHQQGGVRADEMRQRVRILDALERDKDAPGLQLEDAEHGMLQRLINDFPFSIAHRDLLQIIDDVNEAKPPAPG
jgi:hypothetical protein